MVWMEGFTSSGLKPTAEDMRWVYGYEEYADKDVESGNHGPFQYFILVIKYRLR
jgi:hypothetical protein